MNGVTFFALFPAVYYLPDSDELVKKFVFKTRFYNIQICFKTVRNYKKLSIQKGFAFSIAFQCRITCINPINGLQKKGKYDQPRILPFFKLLLNRIKLERTFYKYK